MDLVTVVSRILMANGAAPRKGEARAIAASLADQGNMSPGETEVLKAFERLRAEEGPRTRGIPNALVAEGLQAEGLSASRQECAEVGQWLGRRGIAPETMEGELARALLEVRRKAWAKALPELVAADVTLPARAVDIEIALGRMEVRSGDLDRLVAGLRDVVAERLRSRAGDDPVEAARLALEDRMEIVGRPVRIDLVPLTVRAVAGMFGLDEAAREAFVAEVVAAERQRREQRRDAEKRAEALRRTEAERLRLWEATLLPREHLAEVLEADATEIARWLAAGLIPVARAVTPGKSTRATQERLFFDPVVLADLKANVPVWRDADMRRGKGQRVKEPRGRDARAPVRAPEQPPARPVGAEAAATPDMNAAVARTAAMDRYAGHFALARSMDRRITLVTGPTNSGKSYYALERLSAAASGVALAPLRLLAHEFREALAERGVAVALLTGEERFDMPSARHLAATVEMCPFRNPVDVAVIDEAHMAYDRDRGAAWTAAIMGVPAREVIVIGAPDCAPVVKRMAALCDEPVEEVFLERKGKLRVANKAVSFAEIQTGDAVVAFSRREVFALREQLTTRGRSVAVVYGALSPEVRRAEAKRFRDGEAEVLVATDAIGMGLNLGPLRRVVFSSLSKFDGEQMRELSPAEARQIGGRAGRYGFHEEGIVAGLARATDPKRLIAIMERTPQPPRDLRPQVGPDSDIVAAVAREIGTDSLLLTLERIEAAVLRRNDPNYRLADLTMQKEVATLLDPCGLPLLTRFSYALCPVDTRDNGHYRLRDWAFAHAEGRAIRHPTAGPLGEPGAATHARLEEAEKTYRRLVAWRWLALRFPDAYKDVAASEDEAARLNEWIEGVLKTQAIATACKACGNRLPPGHAHVICDPCFRARRRADGPRTGAR